MLPDMATDGLPVKGSWRRHLARLIATPRDAAARLAMLYPPSFDAPCRARRRERLGDAAGLTQFGVNLLTLPPGAWSSQRHWHVLEDEFVYVLAVRWC